MKMASKRKTPDTEHTGEPLPKRRRIHFTAKRKTLFEPLQCPEILHMVIGHVEILDKLLLKQVCKGWKSIVDRQTENTTLSIIDVIGKSDEWGANRVAAAIEHRTPEHICHVRLYSPNGIVYQQQCALDATTMLQATRYFNTVRVVVHKRADGNFASYLVTGFLSTEEPALDRFTLYNIDNPEKQYHDWTCGRLCSQTPILQVVSKYIMFASSTGVQIFDMEANKPHGYLSWDYDKLVCFACDVDNQVRVVVEQEGEEDASDMDDSEDSKVNYTQETEFIWHIVENETNGLLHPPRTAAKAKLDFDTFEVLCKQQPATIRQPEDTVVCCWSSICAAKKNHLECLSKYTSTRIGQAFEIAKVAAACNRPMILISALTELQSISDENDGEHNFQYEYHIQCCIQAIRSRAFECISSMIEHYGDKITSSPKPVDATVGSDDDDMLVFLLASGFNMSPHICCSAVRTGSINCLMYIAGNQLATIHKRHILFSLPRSKPDVALACMQYLVEDHNVPVDPRVLGRAARTGNLSILQYAKKRNIPMTSLVIFQAAKHLQFECLKYAIDNGCPWPQDNQDEEDENGKGDEDEDEDEDEENSDE